MQRAKTKQNGKQVSNEKAAEMLQRIEFIANTINRTTWANQYGLQYKTVRRVYEALGYPDDKDLDYEYFYKKYERQDIATAVIDRPVDATWNGQINLMEPDSTLQDSQLAKAWTELDEKLRVKMALTRLDKLAGIGQYAVLLLGFSDVRNLDELARPVGGARLKLNYVRPISEPNAKIDEWENNTTNERYGRPRLYSITVGDPEQQLNSGARTTTNTVQVHHSRVLHVHSGSLESEVFGRPRLKPILNRLLDLEKLLGGDAEMFWRGARPGYTAIPRENYTMTADMLEALEEELDKYEHDLRRFLRAEGVDIEALQQQVADPAQHIDVQLQAISAQTGIPKRVLVGTERGELASSQDRDQWLGLVKNRMEEYAEPMILRPFINVMMERGVLPPTPEYNVLWPDLFAPSEKEQVEVGTKRANALKIYADSPMSAEVLPPKVAAKYLLGLNDEQLDEIQQAVDEQAQEEERFNRETPEDTVPPQPIEEETEETEETE